MALSKLPRHPFPAVGGTFSAAEDVIDFERGFSAANELIDFEGGFSAAVEVRIDLVRGFSAVVGRIDLESERVLSTDEGAEMGLERVL